MIAGWSMHMMVEGRVLVLVRYWFLCTESPIVSIVVSYCGSVSPGVVRISRSPSIGAGAETLIRVPCRDDSHGFLRVRRPPTQHMILLLPTYDIVRLAASIDKRALGAPTSKELSAPKPARWQIRSLLNMTDVEWRRILRCDRCTMRTTTTTTYSQ